MEGHPIVMIWKDSTHIKTKTVITHTYKNDENREGIISEIDFVKYAQGTERAYYYTHIHKNDDDSDPKGYNLRVLPFFHINQIK